MTRRFAETTKVPTAQSRGEIEKLLSKHKCQQFGTAVDYLEMKARVQFTAHDRIVRFTVAMPDPKKFRREQDHAQEERRIWRSLLLVIKAKLEAVETGIATFEQEFLANIVMPNGRTVAEIVLPQIAESYSSGRMPLALGAAPDDVEKK
jgi:putative ubiquitin-RnfH superfamily antitoxin RatB of RatAB toxin-antitoxin module